MGATSGCAQPEKTDTTAALYRSFKEYRLEIDRSGSVVREGYKPGTLASHFSRRWLSASLEGSLDTIESERRQLLIENQLLMLTFGRRVAVVHAYTAIKADASHWQLVMTVTAPDGRCTPLFKVDYVLEDQAWRIDGMGVDIRRGPTCKSEEVVDRF